MRNKTKYLAKNIGFLTLGQLGTKILSFLLVPLYTYILTTEQYGTYDLYSTTISLLVPILTLNIADASLRFPLDADLNKKQIISISFSLGLHGIFFCLFLIILNRIFNIVSIFNLYPLTFLILFIVTDLNTICVNLSRGLDKIKQVAISGIICSAVMIFSNILFLVYLHFGLIGFFYANILGSLAQIIYLYIICIHGKIEIKNENKILKNDMVEYSKPLLLNNISWWISSASDRYIVTWFCGVAANGIYSVGYKIPSLLNVFQSIFNQAWTLSAVQDYDKNDKEGFFSTMYKLYNFSMIIICSALIVMTKILALFLYSKEFYEAWKYVPFLLIATLFGALSGYIGGIFAAVKDTKIFARSSIIGAIVNIVLNFILIHFIGVIGAAIATMVSYLVTWILRIIHIKEYMSLKIDLKLDIICYLILLFQTIILLILPDLIGLIINVILFILLLFLNKTTCFQVFQKFICLFQGNK